MIKFDDLLILAIRLSASDVHIQEGNFPCFRINGNLHFIGSSILLHDDVREMITVLLNDLERQAFENNYVLDKASDYFIEGKHFRLRVNISLVCGNPKIAVRIVLLDLALLKKLDLPKKIFSIAEKPSGLFLITGATGAGKSTTLAAMIQYVNEHLCKHIITFEDPIEYIYVSQKSLIAQKECGSDFSDTSFAIQNSLRQDPDIIIIGEIRDGNTVSAALTAAETGHLVLATLHTSNVSQTVSRIIDLATDGSKEFIRSQLANNLAGIISQQLILTRDQKGRIAATELLIANSAAKNLIKEGRTELLKNIMQTGGSLGMHTFEQDLDRLKTEGII